MAMVQEMREEVREEMREEMMKMKVNFVKIEQEAVATKFKFDTVENEAAATKSKLEKEIAATKSELKYVKMEAASTKSKIELLEKEAATKTSMSSLEDSLPSTISQVVRDLPVLTTCAYRYGWNTPSSTITYDRLISDYNNGGAEGVLDITTGSFHCLWPGHYTVTYGGQANLDNNGEKIWVDIYKNNADVGEEGRWLSYYKGSGFTIDQGSRTIVSIP